MKDLKQSDTYERNLELAKSVLRDMQENQYPEIEKLFGFKITKNTKIVIIK